MKIMIVTIISTLMVVGSYAPAFADTFSDEDITGNWFLSCNPNDTEFSGTESMSLNYIYRDNGTFTITNYIHLESCDVIDRAAVFVGDFSVSPSGLITHHYQSWFILPLTQTSVDEQNARTHCGITDWKIGQIPQVDAGQCSLELFWQEPLLVQISNFVNINSNEFLQTATGQAYKRLSVSPADSPSSQPE